MVRIEKRFITVLMACLLILSVMSIFGTQISQVGAQGSASLTGNIYDRGVDTDGDGLFDYLQIDVEVNITYYTEPLSLYRVEVYGLADSSSNHTYVRSSAFVYGETGIRVLNVSLYGPTIYDSGLNPINITLITLYAPMQYSPPLGQIYWDYIESLHDVPLSREYSYTEFDPPSTDVEARFVVYPDDRVVISGVLNYTPDRSPLEETSLKDAIMHGASSITKNEDLTLVTSNSTVIMPPEYASKFPLNSTVVSMLETLSDGLANTGVNITVVLPPYLASKFPFNATDATLNVTYSDGLFNSEIDCSTTLPPSIFLPDIELPPETEQMLDLMQFLLNNTDLSVVGQYENGGLSGTITVHILSGFVLDDLTIGFQGNRTDLSLSGDIRVFYGSYYGFELDEATLEECLLYFNSTVPSLLYEMTQGAINCTVITTMSSITAPLPGADVHFEVSIHGDFVEALANSLLMYMPLEEKEQIRTLIYSALNAAVSSVESASFELGYTHSTRKVSMKSTFAYDVRSLMDEALLLPPLLSQIGPSIPEEISNLLNSTALSNLLNATFSCAKSASVQLTYKKAEKKFDLKMTAIQDIEGYREEAIQLLLEMLQNMTTIPPYITPPEMITLMESLLNTTFCSLKSYEFSLLYKDGKEDIKETYTIEGDPNAQLNYLKSVLLTYFATQPISQYVQMPWQMPFINQTEIDITNVRYSFNLTETLMVEYLGGLAVSPPIDVINATSFQLKRFFNLTADAAFPGEGERLKVTIVGGSNATHTVTLSRPETVPEPNVTVADNRIMVWYNQTLSDLKDLIFNIQPEAGVTVFDIANPELVSATNPHIVNATETAATLLNITEISKPVIIIVRNVTAPPEDVEPPPGTFEVLGNYVEIIASETDIVVNATIRIYYTPEQLEAAGLDENTLKIHYWNGTQWVAVESHVNTDEHYVEAIIDHFSLWALMGQPLAPIWAQLWFWAVIGGVIAVVAAATAVYITRKKKPPPPTPPKPTKKRGSHTNKAVP